MSAITPDSYIKLVRFDVTKEHQITFPDGVAQIDYFRNQINGVVLEASSYQRKDYKVRFEACIDEIEKYKAEIIKAQAIMDSCVVRKKAILNKYLN